MVTYWRMIDIGLALDWHCVPVSKHVKVLSVETIRAGNRLVPETGSLGLATNWHRIGWIDIGLPLDWQLTETRLAAY